MLLSFFPTSISHSPSIIHALYNPLNNLSLVPTALSKALSSLPSLSHSLGEVMLQGVATSHMASAEDGKSEFGCSNIIMWMVLCPDTLVTAKGKKDWTKCMQMNEFEPLRSLLFGSWLPTEGKSYQAPPL